MFGTSEFVMLIHGFAYSTVQLSTYTLVVILIISATNYFLNHPNTQYHMVCPLWKALQSCPNVENVYNTLFAT